MIPIPILSLFLWTVANDPPLQQGGNMRPQDDSAAGIDQAVNSYLGMSENKSIISPGDFTEYPLQLKQGQVVIADARSDAFDPALELVDEKGAVAAKNDDRYPGDQRPLLLWRAPADGTYLLRVKSYQNKSGGQAFMRFQIYDSMELATGRMAETWVESSRRILFRVPMKKGQANQTVTEAPDGWYTRPRLWSAISWLGCRLPSWSTGRTRSKPGSAG